MFTIFEGTSPTVVAYDAKGVNNWHPLPDQYPEGEWICDPLGELLVGGDDNNYTSSAPAVANGVLYLGKSNGKLYAVTV